MCGIIGYIGKSNAIDVIIDGLKKLEYRGYDSSGIAYINKGKHIVCIKKEGRLDNLLNQLSVVFDNNTTITNCAIGHTRWATHGIPNDINAHPHISNSGKLALVHNGIIENYLALKEFLTKEGFHFYSQTDSEVLLNLIEYFFEDNLVEAVNNALKLVKGSYAICVISCENTNSIVVARNNSPLVIGATQDGIVIASDISTLSTMATKAVILNNEQIGKITSSRISLYDSNLDIIEVKYTPITDKYIEISQGIYSTFMEKEIYEIPNAVLNTYNHLANITFDENILGDTDNIVFVGCGTAYHACCIASMLAIRELKISSASVIASEYLYSNPILNERTLVVAISQSGETADTLNVLRLAKKHNCPTIAITNVLNSSISFISDIVLHTKAGVEIGVASTKAYNSQLTAILCLINGISNYYHGYDCLEVDIDKLTAWLNQLVNGKSINSIALSLKEDDKVFFIGRGLDYVTASEGALKLKEISYINCQAIASGELKHGTLALINSDCLVIAIATDISLLDKTLSNISEVRARGAKVVLLSPFIEAKESCDIFINLPSLNSWLMPIISVVPMQQLSLHTAVNLNRSPDKPRNLAKSVTVE